MSDPGGPVLRGGAATALGFMVRFGARFLFLLVAARLFGASLLGAYALALAMVETGVLAAGLGSRWLLFGWLEARGARAARHVVLDAVVLVGLASAMVAVLVSAAVLIAPRGAIAADTRLALLIMAPVVIVQAMIELLLAATRWTHALRWEIVIKNVVQPYLVTAIAVAAAYAGWEAAGLPLSYAIGSVVALGCTWVGFGRTIPPVPGYLPDPSRLRSLLQTTPSNAAADLVDAALGRVDLYLVGILLGETAAGGYAMARQLAVLLRQVRQSFDGLLVPMVARTLSRDGMAAALAVVAAATRLVFALQLPVVIVFAVVGAALLDGVGPGFAAAYPALVLLALADSIQSAFGIGDLLLTYRRPTLLLGAGVMTLLITAGACWLAIPHLGLTGAGLAALIGVVSRGIVRRRLTIRIAGGAASLLPLGPVIVAVLAATIVGAAAWHRPGLALATMLIIYTLILHRTRALRGGFFPLNAASDRSAAPVRDSSTPSATG